MCGKFYYKWQIANCTKSISDYQRQKEDLRLYDCGADHIAFFATQFNRGKVVDGRIANAVNYDLPLNGFIADI